MSKQTEQAVIKAAMRYYKKHYDFGGVASDDVVNLYKLRLACAQHAKRKVK